MLPIMNRIRKNAEFNQVFASGVKVYTDTFFVVASRSMLPQTRYGFVVSSKVGNSVVRHRLVRKLRDTVRGALDAGNVDVVVVARPGFDDSFKDDMVRQTIKRAITKLDHAGK